MTSLASSSSPSTTTAKPPLEIALPGSTPDAAVVWCHGLGDSPHGWEAFCSELCRALGGRVKFILPYAPDAPVSCNGGMRMPSWMDLAEIPIRVDSPDDGVQQAESIATIHAIVHGLEASAGIPPNRVVLGGFSQGGALALAAALRFAGSSPLGGCACLSGWALPAQHLETVVAASASVGSPFLICHGAADGVVESPNGPKVAALLTAGGASDVALKVYPGMGHSSCPQEERDVLDFLRRALLGADLG